MRLSQGLDFTFFCQKKSIEPVALKLRTGYELCVRCYAIRSKYGDKVSASMWLSHIYVHFTYKILKSSVDHCPQSCTVPPSDEISLTQCSGLQWLIALVFNMWGTMDNCLNLKQCTVHSSLVAYRQHIEFACIACLYTDWISFPRAHRWDWWQPWLKGHASHMSPNRAILQSVQLLLITTKHMLHAWRIASSFPACGILCFINRSAL